MMDVGGFWGGFGAISYWDAWRRLERMLAAVMVMLVAGGRYACLYVADGTTLRDGPCLCPAIDTRRGNRMKPES
jgi:hypothetical protein